MTEITVAGPALQLTAADIIEVGERFLSRVAGR
jgi:hypothetical protein